MSLADKLFHYDDLQAQFWRTDFPLLKSRVHDKPLIYLDNAATTQKPLAVIEAERNYYLYTNANVHRGIHSLSLQATEAYEHARTTVQHLLNAASSDEIIFVRGTTEAINLVAQSYGRSRFQAGDEIILSQMEHHSNIVPWQMLCQQTGATLRIIPVNDDGELRMEVFSGLLNEHTRLVAVTHVSNSLGTINPVAEIVAQAHRHGVPVLLDGAQAVSHLPVDVQALDCDFYAFSGHKLYGPTGIGVLYGKAALLEAMPPYQGGGDMIRSVSFAETNYNSLPYKFEAGTPNIAGAIGLGVAIDYLESFGWDELHAHEQSLLTYAMHAMSEIHGLTIIGNAREKISILSFVLDGIHPHDIGTILDREGVAIRTGHHCTMPLMERLGLPATARASFALYNSRHDVDVLVNAIHQAQKVFKQ
ncbi:MAG: cysteine desulfurase [Sideroxydans sp.]|nr:cysteine desulfurase [Sideroxydans sp.]